MHPDYIATKDFRIIPVMIASMKINSIFIKHVVRHVLRLLLKGPKCSNGHPLPHMLIAL